MGFWGKLFGRWRKEEIPAVRSPDPEPPPTSIFTQPASKPEPPVVTISPEGLPPPSYSRIRIGYCDADGEVTVRVITIGAVITDAEGQTRFVAYCHLRGEVRTFRADRIYRFNDPDSGVGLREVTFVEDPVEFRRLIFASPPPRGANAPFVSIDDAYTHYVETLAASGWVVQKRSEPWREVVGLHRHFRRGSGVMKHPSVSLGYAPIFEDWIDTSRGYETVPGRSRDRPWTVSVLGSGTSFATAAEAAAAFEAAAADDEVKRA